MAPVSYLFIIILKEKKINILITNWSISSKKTFL